ncbi:MAG: glycosyltransferase [Actinomycetia bacterium]|nr:glycosyltransferase [Actinomycetes bacterium]
MALVTVMVPTYERVDLLGEAIESALAQTYRDLILMVGDNSESDATENLVRAIDDPRVHYHRNRPGLGPQGNWLDLVARAETPLVASLHDDDLWHPEFLETVVPPMLADPEIGMTFTDFWVIDLAGNRLDEHTDRESARTSRTVIPAGPIDYDLEDGLRLVAVWNAPQPAYAAVLRREHVLAVEFPDDTIPLYDIWLSYDMVKRGVGLRYEPRRLTYYRVHLGAESSAGFAAAEDAVFRRILEESRELGPITDEIVQYWARLQWARAMRLMDADLEARPDARAESQRELRAATKGLLGPRKKLAWAAARSTPAWLGLRLARSVKQRCSDRLDPRYADLDRANPASMNE